MLNSSLPGEPASLRETGPFDTSSDGSMNSGLMPHHGIGEGDQKIGEETHEDDGDGHDDDIGNGGSVHDLQVDALAELRQAGKTC